MAARSVDPASLEIGSASFRRWRPANEGANYIDADGDALEDAVLTLEPSGNQGFAANELLWVRWDAQGQTYSTELDRGVVTGISGGSAGLRLGASVLPNPPRGQASIRYTLPTTGRVRLLVYDVAGHLVTRLVDGVVDAGAHEASFAASASRPAQLYLYRLEWSGAAMSGKFVMVR